MKLKRYIKEITDPTVEKAKKVIEYNIPKLYNILFKKSFNISTHAFVGILNNLFKNNKIKFELAPVGIRKRYRYIVAGYMFIDGRIQIDICNNKNTGKFFRRFAQEGKKDDFFNIERNEFFKELLSILSHEMIHIEQFKKAGKKGWLESGESEKEYLGDPQELEAHAQDAAIEIIRRGTSYTIERYFASFTMKDAILRKFLKKTAYYCVKLKL